MSCMDNSTVRYRAVSLADVTRTTRKVDVGSVRKAQDHLHEEKVNGEGMTGDWISE